jgi:hypothetical protein
MGLYYLSLLLLTASSWAPARVRNATFLDYHATQYGIPHPDGLPTIETLQPSEISLRDSMDRDGKKRWAVFNAASTLACKCTAAMYV